MFIIGDVHSTIDEFNELLKLIEFKPNKTQLYLLGDLVHRGPWTNQIETIRKVQELKIPSIMGNHEEKTIRAYKHNKIEKETGKKNPIKHLTSDDLEMLNHMTEDDLNWMKRLPKFLKIKNNLLIHAGLLPNLAVEKQPENILLRLRWLNNNNKMLSCTEDKKQPPDSQWWFEKYSGNERVFYGHMVWWDNPRIENNTYGLDTGCCFGGKLTCAYIKDNDSIEFIQVNAKQKYSEYWAND